MVVYIHGANIFRYGEQSMPVVLSPMSLFANTGVPLFMLISGFLFFQKEINWKTNLIKKMKRLALPFFIWSGFWVVIEFIGYLVLPGRFENVLSGGLVGIILRLIGIPFLQGPLYGPLWYVRELFIISIIAPIIQKPLRKWPTVFALFAVSLWFLPINSMFRQTVVLFIFGGALSNKKEWIERLKKVEWEKGVMFLLAGAITSFIHNSIVYQLTLALNIISVFIIASNIVKKERIKKMSFKLSQYIFLIYCIHGKPLSIMQIAYTGFFKTPVLVSIGYFILPFLCFVICLCVAVLFKKYFPRMYRFCTGE